MPRLQRMFTLVLAAALVVAATSAFVLTGHLKAEPPRISKPTFRNGGFFSASCTYSKCDGTTFSFRLRKATRLDVTILGNGKVVRTLANRWRFSTSRANKSSGLGCAVVGSDRHTIQCHWDGKTAGGEVAANGVYRVRLRLRSQGWTINMPQDITLDSTPPRVTGGVPTGRTITVGLAGEQGRIAVRLRASEPVVAKLVVSSVAADGGVGVPVFVTHYPAGRARSGASATLVWKGQAHGEHAKRPPSKAVDPGTYVVGWQVTDRAGNELVVPSAAITPGDLGGAAVVRVQTLELTPGFHALTELPNVRFQRVSIAQGVPAGAATAAASDSVSGLLHAPAGLYAIRASATLPTGREVVRFAPLAAPGRAATLAIIPTYSWQLRNHYDGNDDGYPDRPPAPLSLARPLGSDAGKRLTSWIGALGAWATRPGVGSITDEQIELHGVPAHARTLLLTHEKVWTPALIRALDRFARGGGRIVVLASPLDRRAVRHGASLTVSLEAKQATLAPTRTPRTKRKARP